MRWDTVHVENQARFAENPEIDKVLSAISRVG